MSPEDAFLVHAATGVDPTAINKLTAEPYLIVHECRISGTRENLREVNSEGAAFLSVFYDPVLRYEVTAEVAAHFMLADWHPGRSLALDDLEFFNGAFVPFAFKTTGRTQIYDEPVVTLRGGDMSEVSFTVIDDFNDYEFSRLQWPSSSFLQASFPWAAGQTGPLGDVLAGGPGADDTAPSWG